MTLCQNKAYQIRLSFGKQNGREIITDFRGGQISSDAGALLLWAINRKHQVSRRIARCLMDQRDPRYTEYQMEDLVSQRLFQMACGYEDCNDADTLRHDPLFKIVSQRRPDDSLPSQPTLSRFENGISYRDIYRLAREMLSLYLDTLDKNTRRIILDFDVTPDSVYGQQELAFFHGYYGQYVYLPLLVFDGHTGALITAILLPGNSYAGRYAVRILSRIAEGIKERFPQAEITMRADAGFATPELYEYCERAGLGYIIGLIGNDRLEQHHQDNLRWACWLERILSEKQRLIGEFEYRADSWTKSRRVIAKAEWNDKGPNQRYVVTNLPDRAEVIYEQKYIRRGEECENRIKELKLDLKADRLSCSNFKTNQARLLLYGFAYWLMHLLRAGSLKGTELEKAQMGSIRLKLLKIGAQVKMTCRKIWIHLASGYPLKETFRLIYHRICTSSG
jgi:hypothetical protein